MQYVIVPYAQGPSAAPPPAASGVPVAFPSAQLLQYQSLRQQIRNAETAPQRLQEAERTLWDAVKTVKQCEATLAEETALLQKNEGKLEKADKGPLGGPVKKWLFPGKVKERVELMEGRVADSSEAVEAATTALETARAGEAAARGEAATMRAQSDALGSAVAAEKRLVESLFTVERIVADGMELQLRARYDALSPQYETLKKYSERYASATACMEKAALAMGQSAACFRRALAVNTVGMVRGHHRRVVAGPGRRRGPDMRSLAQARMESGQARKGAALYQQAANHITEAHRLCPDVPDVEMGVISATVNSFATIAFDSIVTDLVVRTRIQKALVTIESSAAKVRNATQWMHTTMNSRIKVDLNKSQAEMTTARSQLDSHRRQLLDMALATLKVSGGQPSGASASTGVPPAPPPPPVGTTMPPTPAASQYAPSAAAAAPGALPAAPAQYQPPQQPPQQLQPQPPPQWQPFPQPQAQWAAPVAAAGPLEGPQAPLHPPAPASASVHPAPDMDRVPSMYKPSPSATLRRVSAPGSVSRKAGLVEEEEADLIEL